MLAAAAGFAFAPPAGAQKPGAQSQAMALLARVAPGEWLVRPRDATTADFRICLDAGRELIQLRHRGVACRQFVVQNEGEGLAVSYTCGKAGSGMTRIRYENERLLQIDTQGIDQGLPFAFDAEARHVGPCPR